MVEDMTIDQVRAALDWLEENYAAAMDGEQYGLANALSAKMNPLYRRLQELQDQDRDWGMEWYDTSMELA